MNSILNDVQALEELIRKLTKIDSKLNAGQFIAAYRENRSLIAILEKNKQDIIQGYKDEENKSEG